MRVCHLLTLFFALLIFGCGGRLSAAVTTFNIDLSGDSARGSKLRVFGTISLDLNEPFETSYVSSELCGQHQDDPPRTIPFDRLLGGAALEWRQQGNDLYLSSNGFIDQWVFWQTVATERYFEFRIGERGNGRGMLGRITYNGPDTPMDPTRRRHTVRLPITDNGIFVGTVIVPEPSCFGCLAGVCCAISLWRPRRDSAY